MASPYINKEELLNILENNIHNEVKLTHNFRIKDLEFPVKELNNISFTDIEWENIDLENRTFSNVDFNNCKLININFKNMQLKNVKFNNCELMNIVMNNTTIDTITFNNTTISSDNSNSENSYLELNATNLNFINTKLSNINFFHSKGNFNFISSNLNNVSGYGLKLGSSINIDKSEILDMDFSNSNLADLIIKNSTITDSKINDSKIGEITLDKNVFDHFPIASEDTYGKINITQTSGITVHGTGPVNDVYIANCTNKKDIYLAGMHFNMAKIENCNVADFTFFDAIGKTMYISNVDTYELDLEDAKIERLVLKNVKIRGKIHMKNAKVTQYEAENVVIDANVKINNQGANFNITNTN